MGTSCFSPASTCCRSIPTHTRWAWWWWSGGVGLATVELVEFVDHGFVGEFNVHGERPEQSAIPRPDSGLWYALGLLTSCGCLVNSTEPTEVTGCPQRWRCPPPIVVWSVVRTHITALVTARLGQRHVSSECDLVTREARERLPVRGLTIALGSRHLFRLTVKAQLSVLARSVITSLTLSLSCPACLPSLPALVSPSFPRKARSKCLVRYESDQHLSACSPCLVTKAQKGPAAMPTSLAGIHLLCGPGGVATHNCACACLACSHLLLRCPSAGLGIASSTPPPFPHRQGLVLLQLPQLVDYWYCQRASRSFATLA